MRSMLFTFSAVTATGLLVANLAHAGSYTYRGHLDDSGSPAQGLYDLRLTPYPDAKAGLSVTAPIELRDLSVVDGRFAAVLPTEHLPDDIDRVWLQVEVRGEGESHWTSLPGRQPADLKGTECPASWALSGNAGTDSGLNFLGTTDSQPLTLRVNNSAALRIQPGALAASIIGGSQFNSISPGTIGAVIAGGGFASTQPNTISSDHGAIGGGYNNTISGQNGFIGGGVNNVVSRFGSSVIGGESNTASGGISMVGSGAFNCAGGSLSWAGGFRAKVRPGSISGEPGDGCAGVPVEAVAGDSGTFVWADNQDADFVSSGTRQFLVRAEGGAVITAGGGQQPPARRRYLACRQPGQCRRDRPMPQCPESDCFLFLIGALQIRCRRPSIGSGNPRPPAASGLHLDRVGPGRYRLRGGGSRGH